MGQVVGSIARHRLEGQSWFGHNIETHIILRLGSLDTPMSSPELAHTWVSEAVYWFDIDGELPAYEKAFPADNEGVRSLFFHALYRHVRLHVL